MKKLLIKLGIWAALAVGLIQPAYATNLLVNGNFLETNASGPQTLVPPGWVTVQSEQGVLPNTTFGTPSYLGSTGFYDFGGKGRNGASAVGDGIAQTFATTPGKLYTLTFGYNSEYQCQWTVGAQDVMHVSVGDLSQDLPVPYPMGTDFQGFDNCFFGANLDTNFRQPWKPQSLSFHATSATTTLTFTVAQTTGGANDPMIVGVDVSEVITGPTLTVNKALPLSGVARINGGDQFTLTVKDKSTGTPVSTPASATTKGAGNSIDAGSGTTGALNLSAATTYILGEDPSGSTHLLQYVASVSCSNPTAGGTDVSSVSLLGELPQLKDGDAVTCTVTNTPKAPTIALNKAMAVTGRINPADQFIVEIKNGSTLVSSGSSATTKGSGSGVDGGTGTTNATLVAANTTYTLTEEMAANSVSTLSQYNSSLSCSNTLLPADGGSSMANASSGSLTPNWGDVITCTLTNTAKGGATLSGKVILDTGVGSGTPHNGAQDGAEPGQAGVVLTLTNCSGTVYATTTSGSDGSFSLPLVGVPANQAACLVQIVPVAYQAVSVNAGNTAGTGYNASTTTLSFTPVNGSSYSNVVLGNAPLSTLITDGTQQTVAGSAVVYSHIYTAGSAGSVQFATSEAPSPVGPLWTSVIFRDNNCDGQLDGGDTVLTTSVTVAAGDRLCLLNRVFTPIAAFNGALDSTTLTARETWSTPTLNPQSQSHVLKNTDLTLVSTAGLTLIKEVRSLTTCPTTVAESVGNTTAVFGVGGSARPGAALEYRIRYTNNTAAPLTAVEVHDMVPYYTTFRTALCLSTPSRGITGCNVAAPASGATTGAITWTMGDIGGPVTGLQPQDGGAVSYCVQVQSN